MVRKRALKEGGQRDVCSEVKIDYEMQPMVAEKAKHCDKHSDTP